MSTLNLHQHLNQKEQLSIVSVNHPGKTTLQTKIGVKKKRWIFWIIFVSVILLLIVLILLILYFTVVRHKNANPSSNITNFDSSSGISGFDDFSENSTSENSTSENSTPENSTFESPSYSALPVSNPTAGFSSSDNFTDSESQNIQNPCQPNPCRNSATCINRLNENTRRPVKLRLLVETEEKLIRKAFSWICFFKFRIFSIFLNFFSIFPNYSNFKSQTPLFSPVVTSGYQCTCLSPNTSSDSSTSPSTSTFYTGNRCDQFSKCNTGYYEAKPELCVSEDCNENYCNNNGNCYEHDTRHKYCICKNQWFGELCDSAMIGYGFEEKEVSDDVIISGNGLTITAGENCGRNGLVCSAYGVVLLKCRIFVDFRSFLGENMLF